MTRRLARLFVGLWLYGATMALMIEAHLGLGPWDVLHDGLVKHLPLSFGMVVNLVGAAVLVLWIPLRQRPGIGTVLNVLVIGVATDATLSMVAPPDSIVARVGLLVLGVVGNALAGALYVGAALGPGPRDGLWVAVVRRTGWSIRSVRTLLELTVVSVGFLLGGSVGIATVLYALAIGPLVQRFLALLPANPPDQRRVAMISDASGSISISTAANLSSVNHCSRTEST